MGKYKDALERQKSANVFNRAHDDAVSEVARFVGVSKQIVKYTYKELCTSGSHLT